MWHKKANGSDAKRFTIREIPANPRNTDRMTGQRWAHGVAKTLHKDLQPRIISDTMNAPQ